LDRLEERSEHDERPGKADPLHFAGRERELPPCPGRLVDDDDQGVRRRRRASATRS
jgi:hypothetical protein